MAPTAGTPAGTLHQGIRSALHNYIYGLYGRNSCLLDAEGVEQSSEVGAPDSDISRGSVEEENDFGFGLMESRCDKTHCGTFPVRSLEGR